MTEHILNKKCPIEKLLLSQPIDIPVFHEVALRLQQMMNAHSYKIEEVIKLVNEDAALAAEMLKQANTTYNSGKAPITTIKNAIIRLGSQQVVNLAFTASMANCHSDNPLINAHFRELWRHSHAVAIVSAWLAVEIDNGLNINADEVYLAGLLHDIGRLYVLKLIDRLNGTGTLQIDNKTIETISDKFSIQLGTKVMQQWNIPEIYSNSAGRHLTDDWRTGTNDHLVAAVRLTCKIHTYMEQGLEVTKSSEASALANDELSFLNIDDASHVSAMIKAIND